MRNKPSDRNEAIFVYRDVGHTLRETAEKFHLSAQTVRTIESRVRDFREAAKALRDDPDNIMLLARTGQLNFLVGQVLTAQGIERISQLEGYTLRDLFRIPNMGRVGTEQILKLAAARGIIIK